MTQDELLDFVVTALERLGLRYFVTGSVAAILFGETRFTNDIDIVVDLPLPMVDPLCDLFPDEDFYVSNESARQAVIHRRQFNIIHPTTAMKIDIMVPPESNFNRSRFARAKPMRAIAARQGIMFTAPEDIILMKLSYYRDGGSDKHLRDIAGMLRISGDKIDLDYVDDWAGRLDLDMQWQTVRRRASPAEGS